MSDGFDRAMRRLAAGRRDETPSPPPDADAWRPVPGLPGIEVSGDRRVRFADFPGGPRPLIGEGEPGPARLYHLRKPDGGWKRAEAEELYRLAFGPREVG
jgi:hypothetical protein